MDLELNDAERLTIAISRSGLRQFAVAEKAGISDVRLSLIVNRRAVATRSERRAIAKALGVPISRLFIEPLADSKGAKPTESAGSR